MGRRPEFTDPKVVAQGEGREGGNAHTFMERVSKRVEFQKLWHR